MKRWWKHEPLAKKAEDNILVLPDKLIDIYEKTSETWNNRFFETDFCNNVCSIQEVTNYVL